MKIPELKPCPFCGGTKLKIERKSTLAGHNGMGDRVEQHTYSVRCNTCYARGSTVGGKVIPHFHLFYMGEFPLPEWATTDDALQNKAVLAWNKRSVNPTPVGYKMSSTTGRDKMMCSKCLKDITEDSVFCKYCGAKMEGELK